MPKLGLYLAFKQQALAGVRAGQAQQLEGVLGAELDVANAVDLSDATATEQGDDLVAFDALAGL